MQSGQHLDDAWFTSMIEQLQEVSPEFHAWWLLHEVRQQRELPIAFSHPQIGSLHLQPITVQFSYDQGLYMRVLLPVAETDTAAKLLKLMCEQSEYEDSSGAK
ncbi:hypothetical protein EPA93_03720 [Ktedonosporobacter rubrisoli]|uniref:MmyB-like transcription regulator ligand binding domain-containing protein n=2 Tax=Ktedonosporobacter rubrisoli TaxID=2509675 RepID=A0A4P6JJ80_KTERU|nr:hypothetical protein EPA93_03720 [Ktedonosporobacter rubrisoli]